MSTTLPVADGRTMRGYVRTLARRHPRLLGGAVLLHVFAAAAALAAPRLLGGLVEAVENGTTTADVDRTIALLAALSATANFSVGCYCENEARCHRSLLKQLLADAGAQIV